MKQYAENLKTLKQSLDAIDETENNIFLQCEMAISTCQKTLDEMRMRVLKQGFASINDECTFFKTVKSEIVSYIVFYINLVHIERYQPMDKQKSKRKFFASQIELYQRYFSEHREFYEYYIRGLSNRDMEFFTRKNYKPRLHFDSIPAITDPNFSTSYDLVLAKILGNTRTIIYLQDHLLKNEGEFTSKMGAKPSSLKWTGAKIDLVELVYALQSSGLINNGQAGLNELSKNMEILFGIELGDIYRSFLEIRTRKSAPTKLLDILKTSLINKMIEADG
ncbi:MAG TPA: RteC domain-containing protein [Aequorivita sp.]|nr:RteC domain-containing protein [Aequorivita sp.]